MNYTDQMKVLTDQQTALSVDADMKLSTSSQALSASSIALSELHLELDAVNLELATTKANLAAATASDAEKDLAIQGLQQQVTDLQAQVDALEAKYEPKPSAPTGVSAIPGDKIADLNWVAVPGATGYRVSRLTGDSINPAPWTVDVAATALTQRFTSLFNGTTYSLSVAAINAHGVGPAVVVDVTPKAPVVVPPTPVQPTGGTRYQDTKGATFSARINTAVDVTLPPGQIDISDFVANVGQTISAFLYNTTSSRGSGVGQTVIKLVKGSSKQAAKVPATSGTNPLRFFRVGPGGGKTPKVLLSGQSIIGSDQSHFFHLLQAYMVSGDFTDLYLAAGYGGGSAPPPETFLGEAYKTVANQFRFTRVEADGRDPETGKPTAATAFGVDTSDGVTFTDTWAHHTGFGHGYALWMSNGCTLTNARATDIAKACFNLERMSGTVLLDRPTALRSATGKHLIVDSDQSSAKVIIRDPIYDGPKFVVSRADKYTGDPSKPPVPNTQLLSDITLFVGGASRPDLLQFVK